jgi:hypothetical protein
MAFCQLGMATARLRRRSADVYILHLLVLSKKGRSRRLDPLDQQHGALGDVHLVQGLLKRAALAAVTTAGRHDQSWAEIAKCLT